jgi:hypothetical protein
MCVQREIGARVGHLPPHHQAHPPNSRQVHHLSRTAHIPTPIGRPKRAPGHEDGAPLRLSLFRHAEINLPVHSRSLPFPPRSLIRVGELILKNEGVGLLVPVLDAQGHAGVADEVPGLG